MRPADLATAHRVRADLASGKARADRAAAGVSAADVARLMRPPVTRQTVTAWDRREAVPKLRNALAYGRVMARLAESGTGRGAQ